MDRSVARIGSWAGVVALVGIVGYHLGLTALVGQRVSGTVDAGPIRAYYGHAVIAAAGVEQFLVLPAVMIFVVALRLWLATSPFMRFVTGVALAAAIAEAPVIVTEIAIQAGLVAATAAGEPVVGLFRVWDAAYNSGAYALEATWVAAFGLAMRGVPGVPRVMPALSVLTAVLLGLNVFAIWVGIPDAATLPSAVLFAAWIGAGSVALRRAAGPARSVAPVLQPA